MRKNLRKRNMDRKFITVREKSYKDSSELDPYDTGEVTRKQLYTYLFTDFIRVSMIVAFLFLDTVCLVELWYVIPNMSGLSDIILLYFGGFNIVAAYYLIALGIVEFYIVVVERRFYHIVKMKMSEITQTD